MSVTATTQADSAAGSGASQLFALETLARAARQVALYGPDHPLGQAALLRACEDLFSLEGSISFEAGENDLFWKGIPIHSRRPAVRQLLMAMRARFIASIELHTPVHAIHLGLLLSVLATDPEELASSGGVAIRLENLRCGCIQVEQYSFSDEGRAPSFNWRNPASSFTEEDAALLRELVHTAPLSARQQEASPPIVIAEDEVILDREPIKDASGEDVIASAIAQTIQRAGEQQYQSAPVLWEKWQEQTAHTLSSISPRWRSLIFRAPVQPAPDYPDMLEQVACALDAFSCVSAILADCSSLQSEKSSGLKLALQRVLADPSRNDEMKTMLREQAITQGIPDAIYQNVIGLLLPQLEEKQTEADTLVGSSAPNLADYAKNLAGLADLVKSIEPEPVVRSFLHLLSEVVEEVTAFNHYGAVVGLLSGTAEDRAQEQDADGLLLLLMALENQATTSTRDPSWRALAVSALTRVSTESVVACLAQALPWALEDRAHVITSLLGRLGEGGIRELVQMARGGDSYHAEVAVAALLECDGEDCPHLRDTLAHVSGHSRDRMLAALVDAAGKETSQRLAEAVSQAGEDAKIRLVQLITEKKRRELAGAVLPWLGDAPLPIVSAVVQAIAELGLREAVPALCHLFQRLPNRGEALHMKETIVLTLGLLQATTAVPLLCDILRGGALLPKITATSLRVAAASSLALIGGLDARRALEKGKTSLHPAVRWACTNGLNRLVPQPSGEGA